MNILSIGNSFSQDAQRYLHEIAAADGVCLDTVNLYIGGCPLSLHEQNMRSGQAAYTLEVNGQSTDRQISLQQALAEREWDVITLQQVSHESNRYETYQPYLNALAAYVKAAVPGAKLAIHQTWAYEQGSQRLTEELGYRDHTHMFRDVKEAYDLAAREIRADLIIPAGALFQQLIAHGVEKIHRDTFHASFGTGRYALGMLWYAVLTGRDIQNNPFEAFDEPVSPAHGEAVKRWAAVLAREARENTSV